jgi:hypothetical protein
MNCSLVNQICLFRRKGYRVLNGRMNVNDKLEGMRNQEQAAYPNIPYLFASKPMQHVDKGNKNSSLVF